MEERLLVTSAETKINYSLDLLRNDRMTALFPYHIEFC